METLRQYLDNMFASLPQTEEFTSIKLELLDNMEEKYNALKAEGKSENEAIGIVIAEFGNIDELLKEMGIHMDESSEENLSCLDRDTIDEYIRVSKWSSRLVSVGVALILMGTAFVVLLSMFLDHTRYEGLMALPIIVALIPAVALFIFAGQKDEAFKYIKYGKFHLSPIDEAYIKRDVPAARNRETVGVITGISFILVGIIPLIATSSLGETVNTICTVILMIMIAIGVAFIINLTSPMDEYKKLLKETPESNESVSAQRIIHVVSGIVWPLASATFLLLGFFANEWGRAWIIFPVVGILFGVFCSIINVIFNDKENTN